MRAVISLVLALGVTAPISASAQFSYRPAGELQAPDGRPSRPGAGRVDSRVYAPGMRFPMQEGDAYANSQIYGPGGYMGPGGGQCAASNYSYPWYDNYCESRSWDMPLCPSGNGHQGQDIRPATCDDNTHWIVAGADGVITNDDRDGGYAVYLMGDDGTRYDYLHMRSSTVSVGQRVARGDRLGRASNRFGGTSTTIHLHFNLRQNVSGVGTTYAPTYMSLVSSFEELSGPPDYRASFVRQSFPLSSQPFMLAPGEVVEGTIEFRNDGAETWNPGEVFLGTSEPRDGPSLIAASDWVSPIRAASVEASTPPGAVGVFRFSVEAPTEPGDYPQFFGILREGVTWFSEDGGPADNIIEVRVQSVAGRCSESDWACEGDMRVRCVDGTFERETCPGVCSGGACTTAVDADGDGFLSDVDCDDDDPESYPGAREFCDDGIDQDCSGVDATCGPPIGGGDAGPGFDGGPNYDAGSRSDPMADGCGCRAAGDSSLPLPWAALFVGVVFMTVRRRLR
ncbi:MAG: peptidoglycan DD-metalloendopeptidase family protein [Polyangiales bacterium]